MNADLKQAQDLLEQLQAARTNYEQQVLPLVQRLPPDGLEIVDRIAKEVKLFTLTVERSLPAVEAIPKWKDRLQVEPGLDSVSWYERFWAPHIQAGRLAQRELRTADRPLYDALLAYSRRNNRPLRELVPPRQSPRGLTAKHQDH